MRAPPSCSPRGLLAVGGWLLCSAGPSGDAEITSAGRFAGVGGGCGTSLADSRRGRTMSAANRGGRSFQKMAQQRPACTPTCTLKHACRKARASRSRIERRSAAVAGSPSLRLSWKSCCRAALRYWRALGGLAAGCSISISSPAPVSGCP